MTVYSARREADLVMTSTGKLSTRIDAAVIPRFNAEPIIDGVTESLFTAEVFSCRLYRNMP